MIAVIQCAGTKRPDAGLLRRKDGKAVLFVANPEQAPANEACCFAHPDDLSDTGMSWRDVLLDYNSSPGQNALHLCRAFELYTNQTYRRLVEHFGIENTYILSAGWGLISAAFLTPNYDITFSPSARKQPYKLRKRKDHYDDLNMLDHGADEPIVFFGGQDYVPFFCRLTAASKAKRLIFYNSSKALDAPGCLLRRFETATKTNWHYECANALLDGRVNVEDWLPKQAPATSP